MFFARPIIEALETRRLLAVDLAASVSASVLPPSVLVGTVGRGRVSVSLGNVDALPLPRTTPRVDVQVLAFSQATPNGVLVGQARNVSLAGLRDTSRPRNLNVRVSLPRTLSSGEYTLEVVVDPQNRVGESNGTRANNASSLAAPVVVSSAFSRLSISTLTYKLNAATPGSRGSAVASIRNLGNVTTRGTVNLRILASPASSGVSAVPAELGRVENVRLTVGANKTLRYSRNLNFTVPLNVNFDSAQYVLFAEIVPLALTPADNGTQRERRASATQLVNLPAVPRTAAAPLIAGVSTRLTFTATQSIGDPTIGIAESGTVLDSAGRSGRYTYAFVPASSNQPQSTAFSLDFGVGPQGQSPFTADYTIDFTATPVSTFSSRTAEFGVASGIQGTLKVRQTSDTGVAFRVL